MNDGAYTLVVMVDARESAELALILWVIWSILIGVLVPLLEAVRGEEGG